MSPVGRTHRLLSLSWSVVLLGAVLWPGVTGAQPPNLSASQLDEIVAPIALYPDPILSQVMTASTFPDEVKAADAWAAEHQGLQGEELAGEIAAANLEWDASVQALVPFPTVLETMTRDSGWLEDLGNAVLAQRGDVMDSIQRMRKKAQDAGNLKSSEQITVESTSPTVIEIQPADPQVIYVPTYDPAAVYAPAPAGGGGGAVLFGFMAGVMVAEMFDDDWYGGCGFGWSSHTVIVHNNAWGRTWNNRNAYHAPYSRPVYSNRNVNVNVGEVNIDKSRKNVDIDNSKRIDNSKKADLDRGKADAGTRDAKGAAGKTGVNKAGTAAKGKTSAGSAERGYSRSAGASSKGALSGSTNGRSEVKASARGKSSSGGKTQASAKQASGSRAGGRGGKK